MCACDTILAIMLFIAFGCPLDATFCIALLLLAGINWRARTMRRRLKDALPLSQQQRHILLACYTILPALFLPICAATCFYIHEARFWVIFGFVALLWLSMFIYRYRQIYADTPMA